MAVTTGNRAARSSWRTVVLGVGVLALPGAVLAQDDHHREAGGGNGGHYEQPARPAPPQPRSMPPEPAGGGRNGRGPGPFGGQYRPAPGDAGGNGWQRRPPPPDAGFNQGRGGYQGQPAFQGPPRGGDDHDGGHGGGSPWRAAPGYGGPRAPGYGRPGAPGYGAQWNHGWRQDDRYDWRGWREENRDAFHVGRYFPPYRDYSYDRLGVGFYLQPLFFGSDYWIDDPYYYHLPPAYGPYHWVRYYNDALLVNTYTGQVADVIYDFFW